MGDKFWLNYANKQIEGSTSGYFTMGELWTYLEEYYSHF